MQHKLYVRLAALMLARKNCVTNDNSEWYVRHTNELVALVKAYMPSGSGFDNGTKLSLDQSTEDKLVFVTSFHHMTEGGYDGWTEHTVTITPSLWSDFNMKISGVNRGDIKDYIGEAFEAALSTELPRVIPAYGDR